MPGLLSGRVQNFLTRYSMLHPGCRIGVAVSGGADSVVLLHLLHELASTYSLELLVLHVNHQLRGAESDADEEFVNSLARSLHLPCLLDRPQLASGNLEQAARESRRDFFLRVKAQESLQCVALGHTASDQAETVLFRLLRGSGLSGLAGMREFTEDGLIRPLLTLSREEIRTWARTEGIAWRDDSTNDDLTFARNRLRLRTLPALKEDYNRNLETVLVQTAQVAAAEEDYWDHVVEQEVLGLKRDTVFGVTVPVEGLFALHIAKRRRVIRKLLSEVRGNLRGIEAQHIHAILSLCDSQAGHDRVLVPGVDAVRSFATLLLTTPGRLNSFGRHFRHVILAEREYAVPPSGKLSLQSIDSEAQNCAKFKTYQLQSVEIAELDAAAIRGWEQSGTLTLRNWEPGDQFHPAGTAHPEKLKVLFQESRVLLWERRHWPVLVWGKEIIWARLFGPAAAFRRSDESKTWLRLTYAGPLGLPRF